MEQRILSIGKNTTTDLELLFRYCTSSGDGTRENRIYHNRIGIHEIQTVLLNTFVMKQIS
jgi:hypothetical protein